MATIVTHFPEPEPIEVPEPSRLDYNEPLAIRVGSAMRFEMLRKLLTIDTQIGTIWLGFWGVLSVFFFLCGLIVETTSTFAQAGDNFTLMVRYFANIQTLPPKGLGFAPSLLGGGYWEVTMLFWGASVVAWAVRCYERLVRYQWRPFLFFAWISAIFLTTCIYFFHPLLMGTWAEAPGLGLNVDLDWAQNFSVLWGNFYYNPWHMLAIFFLFGSAMLWGMHGATILATASEGSHHEDAEIKSMNSGSHKSMLFWRWTMGFNATPKTIHDWVWWFAVGVVLASALGILTTGIITNDWYVWAVDHGVVAQYGPITRSAINQYPRPMPASYGTPAYMPATGP